MKKELRLLSVVLLLAACASSGSTKSAPIDRNRITSEEISASAVTNALELVRQLRPRWLSERGKNSFRTQNPVILYVDENRVGTVARLAEFSLNDISELHYLDAIAATQRFGIGHQSGAILVYLRRGTQ
jgi:hypothetical protein